MEKEKKDYGTPIAIIIGGVIFIILSRIIPNDFGDGNNKKKFGYTGVAALVFGLFLAALVYKFPKPQPLG